MEGSKLNQANSVINPTPIPVGMAIHPGSVPDQINLLVTDSSPNHRILSVSLIIARTTILASAGHGPGQVVDPMGIAVDPNTRNIFVADTGNYRVQKFTPNFVPIKEWGSQGNGDSQFEFPGPKGIAIDSNGDIYVVDPGNSRVQKFDIDGNFIKAWGSFGHGDGQFIGPRCITFNGLTNSLFVSDPWNKNIQIFTTDGVFKGKVIFGIILDSQ